MLALSLQPDPQAVSKRPLPEVLFCPFSSTSQNQYHLVPSAWVQACSGANFLVLFLSARQ